MHKLAQQGVALHCLFLKLLLFLVVFLNEFFHSVFLAKLVARIGGSGHLCHDFLLHKRTLFSQAQLQPLLVLFVFSLDLAVHLDRGAQTHHHFEEPNVGAQERRVNGQQVVHNHHRVHVVLIRQEVQ